MRNLLHKYVFIIIIIFSVYDLHFYTNKLAYIMWEGSDT